MLYILVYRCCEFGMGFSAVCFWKSEGCNKKKGAFAYDNYIFYLAHSYIVCFSLSLFLSFCCFLEKNAERTRNI